MIHRVHCTRSSNEGDSVIRQLHCEYTAHPIELNEAALEFACAEELELDTRNGVAANQNANCVTGISGRAGGNSGFAFCEPLTADDSVRLLNYLEPEVRQ